MRRAGVGICLLALVTAGRGLLCYVCLPSLTGDPAAQNAAVKIRANITRSFLGMAEVDFQECGDAFDMTKSSAQLPCPWNDDSEVCLDIKHSSWRARTCGRVPWSSDLQCVQENGADGCPCAGTLCNAAADQHAAPTAATLLLLLPTAALTQFLYCH